VVARTLEDRTPLLSAMTQDADDWDALDRADEVRRPVPDMRTVVKTRSRLARLLEDAPQLKDDSDAVLAQNGAVVASLEAHRAAARRLANASQGDLRRAANDAHSDGGSDFEEVMVPAPTATWGTARSADRDVAQLGKRRRTRRRASSALPKGRNFQ
ncbi:MAG: hypothetical protein AAGJ94_15855, partial [Pseudomonadota bacterium]